MAKLPLLPPAGVKWLKALHLLAACLWVGGAAGVLLIQGLTSPAGPAVHGADAAAKLVDDFVIIPGALGCLLTGFVYSAFTGWGFFRQRWLAVKWLITVGGVLFGTFFLGPWLNSLVPVSAKLGSAAVSDYGYMRARDLNFFWGLVQGVSLLFALGVSVLKPWRRGGNA